MALKYRQSSTTGHPKLEKFSFKYESQFSVDSGMSSCPSTPSTPTSPIDLQYRIATEDDRPQILDFLTTFFWRDEPLNKCSKLVVDGEPIPPELREFSMEDVSNGLSMVVLHNGKLVGVSLNHILEKGKPEPDREIHDPKFKKIVALLKHIDEEADVFKRFPESDRCMSVGVLSVDSTYRGQGIAKVLMAKAREMAIEKGCGFMSVVCSSHFTAMALKKLGFELHWSLNYSDYKPHGEVVFTPEPPHKAATVYVQKL